jgi:hypothetical protein
VLTSATSTVCTQALSPHGIAAGSDSGLSIKDVFEKAVEDKKFSSAMLCHVIREGLRLTPLDIADVQKQPTRPIEHLLLEPDNISSLFTEATTDGRCLMDLIVHNPVCVAWLDLTLHTMPASHDAKLYFNAWLEKSIANPTSSLAQTLKQASDTGDTCLLQTWRALLCATTSEEHTLSYFSGLEIAPTNFTRNMDYERLIPRSFLTKRSESRPQSYGVHQTAYDLMCQKVTYKALWLLQHRETPSNIEKYVAKQRRMAAKALEHRSAHHFGKTRRTRAELGTTFRAYPEGKKLARALALDLRAGDMSSEHTSTIEIYEPLPPLPETQIKIQSTLEDGLHTLTYTLCMPAHTLPLSKVVVAMEDSHPITGKDTEEIQHTPSTSIPLAMEAAHILFKHALAPSAYVTAEEQRADILQRVAHWRWLHAHICPYERGSGAVGTILARALLLHHGIVLGACNNPEGEDVNALLSLPHAFSLQYAHLFSPATA